MIIILKSQILSIKRQFIRHVHTYNIPEQKMIRTCLEEQHLECFAWNDLSKKFGLHKFRNTYFPSKPKQKRSLKNAIKKEYCKKYYGLNRWSAKKMHLASQNANCFLVTLINNFQNYVSRLRRNYYKMKPKQKRRYKENFYHNNPHHHSWYHIGFFNYRARNKNRRDVFTVTIPNNNTIRRIDKHHLWCPSVGSLHLEENIKNWNIRAIRMIKIKVRPNHSTDTQLVFNNKYKLNVKHAEHAKVAGIDYNQHRNKILCIYDNQPNGLKGKNIVFNKKRYAKLKILENMIEQLQSHNQHCLGNTRGFAYYSVEDRINHLKAKQDNIIDQEYIHMAHWVFDRYDCVCMEALDAKAMRLRGRGNQKNRNINHRLKTLKPYRLLSIFKDIAMKEHKEIIFVNSKYTTQTDYGTMTIQKHRPGVEYWYHHKKLYLRDPNAAHNILDWSLHPKHHILYRLHKVQNADSLINVY